MTKLQKSASLALCIAVMLGVFSVGTKKNSQNFSMLFPSLSIGWSSELSDEKDKRVAEVDKDQEISYSFKILDIITQLFD